VDTALAEDADAVGLSILSGAHMTLFPKVLDLLKQHDASDIVLFGGGIIPDADIQKLYALGVAKIFTPGTSLEECVEWLQGAVAKKRAA
jgi:methylmalonyl-CoA mutase C-terminal domain/subunit